jgi:aspartyl-tRNA(Asn)/glutamyl-tRNA(Gln) amidotransferase subunit A
MTDEIGFKSAVELLSDYKAGAVSPVDVVGVLRARIERINPKINAFCLLDWETVEAQARASQDRWVKGAQLGRLDGVPVAVKDLLLTDGWPTLRGSHTVASDQHWSIDAPSVARLREQGAILIGKTTTPEFGWKGTTDSPLTGVSRNPWDATKTPGGSSGGSAAALAAGLAPLAHGTDGGGSIRIPGAFCGVFGIKPSFGRVPAYPLSPFGTLAHVGPMARTVSDAALMLTAIAADDARDWHSLRADGHDYFQKLNPNIKGRKIAASPRLGYVDYLDSEVEAAFHAAVDVLERLGAQVEYVDPGFSDPTDNFRTLWWAGAANALGALSQDERDLLDPGLNQIVEAGLSISLGQFQKAANARGVLGSYMRQFMEQFDFLVTPSVAIPAFEVNCVAPDGAPGEQWLGWTPFTYPFNMTQQPASCAPCGFTNDGLPIGLQIVGQMFDDQGVLDASFALETETCLYKEHPTI